MSHTKGPWQLTHIAGNSGVQEWEVRGMFAGTPNTYPIFNVRRGEILGASIYTDKANARLISAAPDLLEALVETETDLRILIINIFDAVKRDSKWEGMIGIVEGWIARNNAAIAKARGTANQIEGGE